MSAKYLMSSLMRHVSTSTHAIATYRVHLVQTKGEFNKKVMMNDKPVVVEFTAAWCRPCRHLYPRLEAGIAKSEIDVDLAKVDLARINPTEEDIGVRCQIDEYDIPALVADFGIRDVPTLIAIKNGKVVDKLTGFYDKDAVTSLINKLKDSNVTENKRPVSTRSSGMTMSEEGLSRAGIEFLKAFEKTKTSDKTLVVLITAEWCQPCKVLMSCIESSPQVKLDKVSQYLLLILTFVSIQLFNILRCSLANWTWMTFQKKYLTSGDD